MTGSRYVYFLSCVALTFAACGCSASSTAPGARAANAPASVPASAPVAHAGAKARGFTTPTPGDARTLAFAKAIGVDCNADSGSFSCVGGRIEVGDYFDITLNVECTSADFSMHTSASAEMRDLITPLDTRTVAMAEPKDALCVQAVGSIKNEPEYYYVVMQAPGASCETTGLVPNNRPGCYAGWLPAESLAATAP